MSPVIENVDSAATDEALTVKYFLAICDKKFHLEKYGVTSLVSSIFHLLLFCGGE